jgi:hypothetical protein
VKYDPELVEYVVREVIRRLTVVGQPVAHAAPIPATDSAQRDLALTERLVTVGTLQGRLQGVAEVSIGRRSVITPAARDELANRKIALKRRER